MIRSLSFVVLSVLALSCVGPAPAPCTQCGDVCVDVKVDSANCGACGAACAAGKICTDGACVATCPVGQKACGAVCADTRTDRQHCGMCGSSCGAGEICENGACIESCPMGQTVCADPGEPGICANLMNDRAHCGTCAIACAMGQVCGNGTCSVSCPGTQTSCNGACTNTMTDRANCGVCGSACSGTQACVAGSCVSSCAAPQIACNGTCVDPRSDPANCNTCGQACSAQQSAAVCVAGACSFSSCNVGFASCDNVNSNGCETDVSTLTDCGGCGIACAPKSVTTATCTAGACGYAACAVGAKDCDGNTANGCEATLATDQNNCGACNRRCPINSACVGGQCGPNLASVSSGIGDDVFQPVGRPRAEQVVIGYEPGSFIHYTFDGTKPVIDGGTTRSVPTPLSIGNVDAGTLRWFAGFPDGGREPDEHEMVRTITAPPHDLGGYVENVRMSSPQQAFGSPYVVASPGQMVTGAATINMWRSDSSGYCPGCALVPQLSMDVVGQVWCPSPTGPGGQPGDPIYQGPAFPGTSRVVNFGFPAPPPGRYYLRFNIGLVFQCNQVGGGSPIGVLVVR